MNGHEIEFEIPKNIERYLSALSKLYAQEGQGQKQEIIVNSKVKVSEAWSCDNSLEGTIYGHRLNFIVPEMLYLNVVKRKYKLEESIKNDINSIHSVQGEFVEMVVMEMEAVDDHSWRNKSGVLMSGKRMVLPEAKMRIWGNEGFRVFLSHKSDFKIQTAFLKEKLRSFGVSAFVAHEDILPTKEWQDEIENALASMDVFVALMTKGFHDSDWTDHEVGYAIARGVPIISVKLGEDPYGFIGKFQALSCTWDDTTFEIVNILIGNSRMLDAYIGAIESCGSFDEGNVLSKILPKIDKLSEQQEKRLMDAYNRNVRVRNSFGFAGNWPGKCGNGLASQLERITGKSYAINNEMLTSLATSNGDDGFSPFDGDCPF